LRRADNAKEINDVDGVSKERESASPWAMWAAIVRSTPVTLEATFVRDISRAQRAFGLNDPRRGRLHQGLRLIDFSHHGVLRLH
jgi:hypothetical protein